MVMISNVVFGNEYPTVSLVTSQESMIKDFLLNILGNSTIYVQFSSRFISVQHVENRVIVEGRPVVATKKVKNKDKIVAVEDEALQAQNRDSTNIHIQSGFEKHPRTVISNVELAAATLSYFIQKVMSKKALLRPVVVLHPTEKLDDGITQIEVKALTELGIQIGARKVYIWQGHTLTTREMRDSSFLEKKSLKKIQ